MRSTLALILGIAAVAPVALHAEGPAPYNYRGAQFQLLGKTLKEYRIDDKGGFISPASLYNILETLRIGTKAGGDEDKSFSTLLAYGTAPASRVDELNGFKTLLANEIVEGVDCSSNTEYRFRTHYYMGADTSKISANYETDINNALAKPAPDLLFVVDVIDDPNFSTTLNKKVSDRTCGVVKDFFQPMKKADVVGVGKPQHLVANTLYLNAPWLGSYKDCYVSFQSSDTAIPRSVPSFWGVTKSYATSSTLQYRAIALPFGKSGAERGRLTLIVPTWRQKDVAEERKNLQELLRKLSTDNTARTALESGLAANRLMDFNAPNLKPFTTRVDLAPILSTASFGLADVTDPAKLPYPELAPKAFTKDLEQVNVLSWDYQHILSVAVTGTPGSRALTPGATRATFMVDRPFIAIVSVNDIVMHAGIIMNPANPIGGASLPPSSTGADVGPGMGAPGL